MISAKMVSLTIDGKTVEVPEGSTVLEAAQKVGIEIPTLCYHKALEPYGACRLCLVELVRSWGSQIVASCGYPAQDGLEVKTDTERVLRNRQVMMELILARKDCCFKYISDFRHFHGAIFLMRTCVLMLLSSTESIHTLQEYR